MCYFFAEVQSMIKCTIPVTKARLIVYGYTLKCADWHWGVWSQFGHIAGNIYFALLPAEEDPAALHGFILHCHCAAHMAAPVQSSPPNSLWFKTDTYGTLVSLCLKNTNKKQN